MRFCGDSQVNNHLQREHSELGTWSQQASKAIHQEELSLGRTPMAQEQLDQMSANGKPALVTHPPGLLERLGRNQAGKPESSISYVWNVTLKMILGNKVVAIKQ